MFGPVKATNGVVVMQVTDIEKNGRPYNFNESATLYSRTRGADVMSQMIPLVLMGNKKVQNNLLEFFHE